MDKIEQSVKNIRSLKDEHTKMGLDILNAANRSLYPLDILAVATLNRSVCLLEGFCDLIEKKNFIAAAPLIRLQLDNLLRFQAAWLVNNPHDFATKILQGEKIRDMKDRDGQKMTDSYLVKKVSKDEPSLESVYEHTSGYIHLSDKHIFNSLGNLDGKAEFNMKIATTDSFIPDSEYLNAIQAFFVITGNLFRYFKGWALTKNGEL